jgi:hypothetical protein
MSKNTSNETPEKYPLPLNERAVRTRAKARGFKLERSSLGYLVVDPCGSAHGFGGCLERCAKWIDQWPTISEMDQYKSLNTITGEKLKVNGEIEYVMG